MALFAIGTALALSVGAYLFKIGTVTLGQAFLIFYYMDMVRRPIQMMMRQIESLQRASASLSRVTELMQIKTEDLTPMGNGLPKSAFSVTFRNISFAYDPDHRFCMTYLLSLAQVGDWVYLAQQVAERQH